MVSFMAWMGFFYIFYVAFKKALQIHYEEKPPTNIKTNNLKMKILMIIH
jgi:DNA-directed RNA polymerase subunit K/omega